MEKQWKIKKYMNENKLLKTSVSIEIMTFSDIFIIYIIYYKLE